MSAVGIPDGRHFLIVISLRKGIDAGEAWELVGGCLESSRAVVRYGRTTGDVKNYLEDWVDEGCPRE